MILPVIIAIFVNTYAPYAFQSYQVYSVRLVPVTKYNDTPSTGGKNED